MMVYICVGAASLLASLLLTPIAARAAATMGWLDSPGVRKIHSRPVAYLGGAAIFFSLFAGFLVLLLLARDPAASLSELDPRVLSLLAGAGLLFVVGLVDDVRTIRPRVKLVAQITAALVVCASGITIDRIHLTDGLALEFGHLAVPITILWIVGITNAVNLIDGMDGLASGLSAVACAAIGWIAYQSGLYTAAAMLAALLGALLGFLPYNLYPARIFLGDSGSMLLGFLLSSTAVLCAAKAATVVGIALPLVALGIPIFDTLFAMMRRILEGRSLFSADRNHIHHRLLALGFGQTRIVMLLCAETACAVSFVLFFSTAPSAIRGAIILTVFALHVMVFRAVGAVHFRNSFSGFSRMLTAARQAKDERLDLDDLELHLREASSIRDWWSAVCDVAASLGFTRLELALNRREEGSTDLTWNASELHAPETTAITMSVPIRQRRADVALPLLVETPTDDSLETAGRRMGHFCRLMDRHSIATLPKHKRKRPPSTRAEARGSNEEDGFVLTRR